MKKLSFETTCITVKSPRLPKAFDGFTLVHLSDLHNGSFGDGQKPLLEEILHLRPDIIVVTGDLIDSEKYFHALTLIRGAAEIAPVFYATGNHEAHTAGYPRLEKEMAACGAHILRNTYVKLTCKNSTILLAGADDPSFTPYRKTAAVMSENLKSIQLDYDFFTILLSHRPDLIKVYAAFGFDVVLCGHAHGGQIRLPRGRGLIAPNQGLFPRYTAGLHRTGRTQMVISRGLGNRLLPIRVNNRPELICIRLLAAGTD